MKTVSKLTALVIAVMASALASCGGDREKYLFQYIDFEETIPYSQTDKTMPRCSFKIMVLKDVGTDTVFADAFNRDVSQFVFGSDTPDVRQALINFVNEELDDFRDYVESVKAEAAESNTQPHYYDREYNIRTRRGYGNGFDIINCFTSVYRYEGGAHGSTYMSCRNYRIEDGSVVTPEEFFMDGYQETMKPMLEKKLLEHAGVSDRSQLQEAGYFPDVAIYVPDDFIISRDSVSFIYNQYCIAPYSTGVTTLTFAYKDLPEGLIR